MKFIVKVRLSNAFLVITAVSVMCQLPDRSFDLQCVHGEVLNSTCVCNNGFTGPRCNEKCPAGTFGKNCWKKCEPQSKHQTCNYVDGALECEAGYTGPTCEQRNEHEPTDERSEKEATKQRSDNEATEQKCKNETTCSASPEHLILAISVIGGLVVMQIVLIGAIFYYKIRKCRQAATAEVELAHLNSSERNAAPNNYV